MRILLFILCIALGVRLSAQDYVVDLKAWHVEDGLLHRQINCIWQDRQGFIWLGTPIGLARFDGVSFRWFTHEKDSLPFNNIRNLLEVDDGKLRSVSPLSS